MCVYTNLHAPTVCVLRMLPASAPSLGQEVKGGLVEGARVLAGGRDRHANAGQVVSRCCEIYSAVLGWPVAPFLFFVPFLSSSVSLCVLCLPARRINI